MDGASRREDPHGPDDDLWTAIRRVLPDAEEVATELGEPVDDVRGTRPLPRAISHVPDRLGACAMVGARSPTAARAGGIGRPGT